MGQYKVPQNVEAEDKILGPLSLKQFIYAVIGVGYGLLTFAIFQKLIVVWLIVGLPPMLLFLAVGLYQKDDQPFELYVVAMLSYWFKPRHRTWEKEPIAEVFRLDPPPPKPEQVVRDPREVRGQLNQLAQVIDTRGWAAKNPELQEPTEQPVIDLQDRLSAGTLLEDQTLAAPPEVTLQDDILDTKNNQRAQDVGVLIENSVKNVRQEMMQKMLEKTNAVAMGLDTPAANKTTTAMTAPASSDIVKIALESGDLTVSQLAAKADRQKQQLAEGEAISLRQAGA